MKRRVGFTSASMLLTLTVLRAPVIVVTRSFRLSFTYVKFLPTMAEAAARQMSYTASQLYQACHKHSRLRCQLGNQDHCMLMASEHATIEQMSRSRCCRELHYWPAGPSAGLTYSCECDNSRNVSVMNVVCALLRSFFLLFVYVSIIYSYAHWMRSPAQTYIHHIRIRADKT